MADDLFRVPSLSSKNSFQSNSLFNPAKQASNVLDDTSSKSQVASASKGYLPVFDLVPKYDDDIFQGVPGTKSATAGTVYDDLLGGVVNSTAAPHVVGRLSSGTNSTVRRPNSTDVSSGVNRDGLYEPNSSQPSRSRWGKPQTQYVRWSKPSSAGSDDFPHKPAKVKSRDDDHFVDPVSPEHRQEGTVLDSLDAFSMFHTGGRNIPTASKISNETSRTKGNTASIGSRQSTTVSSQSKPSHSSYLRQFENGNLNSSESTDKTGVLEGRTVSQHMHQSDPTTSRWSTPLSPSARNKSQHNTESRYGSPVKSNELLADKLTPSKGFNVEQNAELIGHSKPRGFEEVWLAVDDVRLVTRPTLAPPPSRLPPPLGLNKNESRARRKSSQIKGFDRNWLEDERRVSSAKVGSGSALGRQAAKTPASGSTLCPEKMSKVQLGSTNYILPEEQRVANVAAAPELDMKEAIKRAEALLKLGKELEEKELSAKAAKEAVQEGKENASSDVQRGGKNEHHHTDARQQKFDQERSWRHRDHERAKDNLAFESANLEAHGNAGGKTPPQTREKAEKAAVHRITAEVRERAAAAAREKVAAKIKTVTEARVKAAAEAREGATVHARDQSALESRERVALEARKN